MVVIRRRGAPPGSGPQTRPFRFLGLVAGLAASMVVGLAFPASAVAPAPSPEGVWIAFDDKTGKPESHVQVYRDKGKTLAGKIIRLIRDPKAICEGCKGKDKGRSRVGLRIMWDLQKDDDEWDDGRIFDPKKGKDYRCKIWLDGPNTLKVRGYLGPLYRTQTWKRLSSK